MWRSSSETTTLALDNKCYKKFNMSEIKTVVYFDVEATGLKKSGRPRITEVSFVAMSAKDVLESKIEVGTILPRIVNKLTVCVYPMAIIRPEVEYSEV